MRSLAKKYSMRTIPICLIIAAVVSATLFVACHRENTAIPTEPDKDITGSWHVVKIVRNNIDISAYVDLTKFSVTFKDDKTYTIDNQLPFIVSKNGNWSLDDVKYPQKISFTPQGSTAATSTNLNYPVVQGKRQMILVFSPGCVKNVYQYTLTKQ